MLPTRVCITAFRAACGGNRCSPFRTAARGFFHGWRFLRTLRRLMSLHLARWRITYICCFARTLRLSLADNKGEKKRLSETPLFFCNQLDGMMPVLD